MAATTGASIPKKTFEQTFTNIYTGITNTSVKTANPQQKTPYQIRFGNWYKTIPYALRIVNFGNTSNASSPGSVGGAIAAAQALGGNGPPPPESNLPMFYFFPVNPESISINTPFATVVTPTIGGVVQEHSGAVFYNITINGTTGVLPELDHSTGIPRNTTEDLRPLGKPATLINANALGGFGQGAINAINSIAAAITGTSSKLVSGKNHRNAGYTAFHVLYKFIWLYHFAKSNGAKQQLRFMNYKDNNQYDCVVTNFTLNRDKGRPHLYQYSIQLKGWKLATANAQPSFTNADRLKNLGLDEGPSFKATAFRLINNTKTVLNGAAGLLNAAAGDLVF
jgi:hypothetical protein